jgi:hypothetical protein
MHPFRDRAQPYAALCRENDQIGDSRVALLAAAVATICGGLKPAPDGRRSGHVKNLDTSGSGGSRHAYRR